MRSGPKRSNRCFFRLNNENIVRKRCRSGSALFNALRLMLPPFHSYPNRRRFLQTAVLVSLMSSCRKAEDSSSGVLRVGMDLTYPPFEMLDATGQPDGVGVRLAEALATYLGRSLKIVPMEFEGLIPALKSGHIDLIISSLTANDERRESIDFSEPYAFTGLAILAGNHTDVQSVEDLKKPGRIITAKSGTTGEAWSRKNLTEAKVVVFTDQAACVTDVAQGRADAFIYDQLSIYSYHMQNRDTTRGLLRPFVEESWAIGVAKGRDTLRQQVNEFLVSFRSQDGFNQLGERYLKDEKKLLEEMGIPFILR